MFIHLRDLELQKLDFKEVYPPGVIDFGDEIEQTGPLGAEGLVELIEEDHGNKVKVRDIRLVGSFQVEMGSKCARCLEPVRIGLGEEFELLYRPIASVPGGDEIEISQVDSEISFYKGDGLQLEEILKEQVLLAVPVKVLCREDCEGLCPHCGQNRNRKPCQCSATLPDPRWAALAGLKEKLKG